MQHTDATWWQNSNVGYREILRNEFSLGWRRLIGCLKLQVIFHTRATNYRTLWREMTSTDRASYVSSPSCSSKLTLKSQGPVTCCRCVAVCCSVLQCVAVCYDVLQCVAMFYVSLEILKSQPATKFRSQRTATHCDALQQTATHCKTLQHITAHWLSEVSLLPNLLRKIVNLLPNLLRKITLEQGPIEKNYLPTINGCPRIYMHILTHYWHVRTYLYTDVYTSPQQRVAQCGVCCSVLQCVAVCCSVLWCVAMCCNAYKYVYTSPQQRVAQCGVLKVVLMSANAVLVWICVWVYACTYMCILVCICAYVYICIYVHGLRMVLMSTNAVFVCIYVCVCMRVCMYAYVCIVCICVYVYMCTFVYMCMFWRWCWSTKVVLLGKYVWVYAYTSICGMYLCICVYLYVQVHTCIFVYVRMLWGWCWCE